MTRRMRRRRRGRRCRRSAAGRVDDVGAPPAQDTTTSEMMTERRQDAFTLAVMAPPMIVVNHSAMAGHSGRPLRPDPRRRARGPRARRKRAPRARAGERGGVVLFKRNVRDGACADRRARFARAILVDARAPRAADPAAARRRSIRKAAASCGSARRRSRLPPMRRLGDLGDVDLVRRARRGASARARGARVHDELRARRRHPHARRRTRSSATARSRPRRKRVARFAGAWARGPRARRRSLVREALSRPRRHDRRLAPRAPARRAIADGARADRDRRVPRAREAPGARRR